MRIHFTGIAGAGMSAVALMMRDAGHEVSGSDAEVFPPMSTYVEGLGFPFHRRFDAANLPDGLDMLVLGASVTASLHDIALAGALPEGGALGRGVSAARGGGWSRRPRAAARR